MSEYYEYDEMNEESELSEETEQDSLTAHEERLAMDYTPFAEAGASVFNGPNGVEVCKTIRHGFNVVGGVVCFGLLLDFIARLKAA